MHNGTRNVKKTPENVSFSRMKKKKNLFNLSQSTSIMRGRYRIEVTRCEEEQIFAPERDDLQLPDIPFAPIDQHPAISTLKLCWSFFFTSPVVPPESCVLKRSLSETLRYFPLSRKVVDWPLFPSLSGRKSDDLGVYWKEVDVLYRREKEEEEKERNKEIEKMMERVERETKPLTIPRRSCMAVKKTNIRSFTRGKEEKWVVLTFFVKHYACDGDSMKTFLSFVASYKSRWNNGNDCNTENTFHSVSNAYVRFSYRRIRDWNTFSFQREKKSKLKSTVNLSPIPNSLNTGA